MYAPYSCPQLAIEKKKKKKKRHGNQKKQKQSFSFPSSDFNDCMVWPFFKDEVPAIVSKLAGSIDVAAIACVQKAS